MAVDMYYGVASGSWSAGVGLYSKKPSRRAFHQKLHGFHDTTRTPRKFLETLKGSHLLLQQPLPVVEDYNIRRVPTRYFFGADLTALTSVPNKCARLLSAIATAG